MSSTLLGDEQCPKYDFLYIRSRSHRNSTKADRIDPLGLLLIDVDRSVQGSYWALTIWVSYAIVPHEGLRPAIVRFFNQAIRLPRNRWFRHLPEFSWLRRPPDFNWWWLLIWSLSKVAGIRVLLYPANSMKNFYCTLKKGINRWEKFNLLN